MTGTFSQKRIGSLAEEKPGELSIGSRCSLALLNLCNSLLFKVQRFSAITRAEGFPIAFASNRGIHVPLLTPLVYHFCPDRVL